MARMPEGRLEYYDEGLQKWRPFSRHLIVTMIETTMATNMWKTRMKKGDRFVPVFIREMAQNDQEKSLKKFKIYN